MATVSAALAYGNSNLTHLLPPRVIRAAAVTAGHRWRQRKLGPAQTVQLRTLSVFDLHTGLLLAQHDFASDRHESPRLRHVLDLVQGRAGDGVVFDRGLVSYANLCLLQERGMHGVARLAKGLMARRGTGRTRGRRLGKRDAQVRWHKPARRPRSARVAAARWRRFPPSLDLRQVSVSGTSRQGHRCRRVTLITTLTDAHACPAAQIAARRRWEIETDLRHLKSTLKLEFLRTRSRLNIQRELLLRAIAYNLVRRAMLRSAQQRGSEPQRVRFADACRWLRLIQATGVSLLKLLIHPRRTRRPRPRKLKYRGKNYRLQTTRIVPQTRIA